ncbi:2-oxo acid dehydrogenase subunit E2 [Fertoebacter nigrum]|uniref:Dihydrolipoamide acetyltransferase component of pyruvate dehydrogenase complex n=1 Tax=Fertoeibacter niger TaxID=2656921 RepID=A0A8X8KPZ6_9RHOB|nr:dihydrolipoamide acetyltransferase family protein [Fertoeibacter niger]NUB45645.1 2-oxo acid dehydrogenase subunit E2 [Fertoeibacter niger]
MGIHIIRVPDIGEGIAETEIAEWFVKPGDLVAEDQPIAAMMTDKATVDVPTPVAGRVIALAAEVGATLAVRAELIRLEVAGEGNLGTEPQAHPAAAFAPVIKADPALQPSRPAATKAAPSRHTGAPLAAPSVRALARDTGVDLRLVTGSGPEGRILREDVANFDARAHSDRGPRLRDSVEEVRIIGLRKRISQRMQEASRVPHITIVEEVDASALEILRLRLNDRARSRPGTPRLTLLPLITRAIVQAVADQPMMNAHHDPDAGLVRRFGAVHIGIAAQTTQGLVVPVLRHAEALGLTETASEIARLADAARGGRATRDELSGSTITITSLGTLGALATTPILNVPEVAIIGINRMATRPFWTGSTFEPRKMMNISCSFDHRVVDGWDAAVFVQKIKDLLETPALLFVEP